MEGTVASRSRSLGLGVGAALALLATTGLVWFPAAARAQPTPTPQVTLIVPTSAPAGWPIVISGSGRDAKWGPVSVYSSSNDLISKPPTPPLATQSPSSPPPSAPSAVPDSDGFISLLLVVPSSLPLGDYTFFACQDCLDTDSHPEASHPFTVKAPPETTFALTPPAGKPGSAVRATGTGWNPLDGGVTITPPGATSPGSPLLVTPHADGSFSVPIQAPGTPHTYTYVACQDCDSESKVQREAHFTVASLLHGVFVPNLVGLDTREAETRVHARGLTLAITWTGSGTERGSIVSQVPHAGRRVPPGTQIRVTAQRTPAAVTAGRRWPPAAVAAAVLAALLAATAAITVGRLRPRRWVRRHIRVEPHVDPTPELTEHRIGDSVDLAIRLVPHGDRGVQTLEEVTP